MNCTICAPSSKRGSAVGDADKMPGHWLLASLGKRVLRPGGLELTRVMLDRLSISAADSVIEFAPGLGVTARMTLQRNPAAYTAIERDASAATTLCRYLTRPSWTCMAGSAEQVPLPGESATVIYGEAMLTMQRPEQKRRILAEAFRLLKPGGRYGIHEMILTPDDLSAELKTEISHEMSRNIHVGARPLTACEWRGLLEITGFAVQFEANAPMHLLKTRRLIQDEGPGRALRFAFNVLCNPDARRRVLAMHRMFSKHARHLAAVTIIAIKPQ